MPIVIEQMEIVTVTRMLKANNAIKNKVIYAIQFFTFIIFVVFTCAKIELYFLIKKFSGYFLC